MKEVFHFAPSELYDGAASPEIDSGPMQVSLTSGEYVDPPPKVVDRINRKFKEPSQNMRAVVMKAFELAGLVPSEKDVKDLAKPLEQSGLLPSGMKGDSPPEYSIDPSKNSEFTDLRDEALLIELEEGEDERNRLIIKIKEMAEKRLGYSGEEVDSLRKTAVAYTRQAGEAPPVVKIIAVMTGHMSPRDPEIEITSEVPTLSKDMATDIYWMMVREKVEQQQNTSQIA